MKNGDFPVRYVTNYQRVPGITWISFRHRNFLCNSYSSMFWKILAKFKVSAVHADSSVDLRAVFLAQSLGARHTVAPHHRRLRMNLLPTKKSWLWSQNCRSSSFFFRTFFEGVAFCKCTTRRPKVFAPAPASFFRCTVLAPLRCRGPSVLKKKQLLVGTQKKCTVLEKTHRDFCKFGIVLICLDKQSISKIFARKKAGAEFEVSIGGPGI